MSSGPPPPPPPGPGGVPYSIPVAYGGPQPAPTGLRTATIILMWLTVAAHVLLTVAAFVRKSTADDFIAGDFTADVDGADDFVGAGVGLVLLATLATAIVLAVWSYRTTSNARARGAQVSPGLAAGGWFIPIGWYFVSFAQLRNAMRGRDSSSLNVWQSLWVIGSIGGGIAAQLFDVENSLIESDTSPLRNQSIGLAISTVVLVAATVFAMRALKAVDDATSS